MINMVKLPTKKSNLFLRVAKGHFATSHSHINYYGLYFGNSPVSVSYRLVSNKGSTLLSQIIQDGLIVPKVMGKITGLNPAIILLSLSVWGALMGIVLAPRILLVGLIRLLEPVLFNLVFLGIIIRELLFLLVWCS